MATPSWVQRSFLGLPASSAYPSVWAREFIWRSLAESHGTGDPLYGCVLEWRALDCNRRGSVCDVVLHRHFFGAGGRRGVGNHDGPDDLPYDGGNVLLVPQALREAALRTGSAALADHVVDYATHGDFRRDHGRDAGVRARGRETAPLLFTTLGNSFWNLKIDQATAALPLQIYVYANSPYDDWHRQAWAGAFVLIVLIVTSVAAVRYAVRARQLRSGINYGSRNPGREPERVVWQGQALYDINLKVAANHATSADWSLRLREIHVHRSSTGMHETIPEALVEAELRIRRDHAYNAFRERSCAGALGFGVPEKRIPFPHVRFHKRWPRG